MKKRTIAAIVVSSVMAAMLLCVAGTYTLFTEELKIASSISKLEGQNLYTMTVKGDYYFDEVMNGDISNDKELSKLLSKKISHGFYNAADAYVIKPGCSVISALNSEGDHVWGRNFDWNTSVPMVVKSIPKNGYKSISTVEFTNINTSATSIESMGDKMLAIAGLYVPMDGINEKGLCIADLEVNEGGMIVPSTDKKDITVTMAIRLALNKAATVDEAINLFKGYDICPSGNISHHLAVSDETGKSVSVEFNGGEMVVVETPVVTNTNLTNPDQNAGGESSKRRFDTLKSLYDDNSGILEEGQILNGLKSVVQENGQWVTKWSIVFRKNNDLSVTYYLDGHYDTALTETL